VIRVLVVSAVLAGLVACGTPDSRKDASGRPDTRQQPSTLTPGLHVSGDVTVGVVKHF
jgi:hypothetical protein